MSRIKERLANLTKKAFVNEQDIMNGLEMELRNKLSQEGCDSQMIEQEIDGIVDLVFFNMENDIEIQNFIDSKIEQHCNQWLNDTKLNDAEYLEGLKG